MKRLDIALLLFIGFAIWLVGTLYYGWRGAAIFETSRTRYWIAFIVSPLFSAILCLGILRWRHIAPRNWAPAMLLLALPGMVGEVIVLSNFSTFMPRMHAASRSRYGAFLFAAYALVLGVAEAVTLAATP
jgi:Family of unknown function (DUF5367)